MLLNGFAVFGSAITLIGDPTVMREFIVQVAHKIIAVGLGQDAGGSDGGINSITFYYAFVRQLFILSEAVPIDEQEFCLRFHFVKRQVHGLERSVQNIDTVNFFMINHGYAVAYCLFFDITAEYITVFFSNLLRIIQQGVMKAFG